MTIPPDHLQYARRRAGLDHDWYEHQTVFARRPIAWPGGAKIALWIVVPIEFFPLDGAQQPFRPIGGLDPPIRISGALPTATTAIASASIASCGSSIAASFARPLR